MTAQIAAPALVATAAAAHPGVVSPGEGIARWGSAAELFDSPTGFDPVLRDALYRCHEAHDALCCDPFGPFCPASLAYARACAGERDTLRSLTADVRHAAYHRGDCVDCRTEAHSAGRTRCDTCHARYVRRLIAGEAP